MAITEIIEEIDSEPITSVDDFDRSGYSLTVDLFSIELTCGGLLVG
jgi:hypothetical protein